MNRRKRAVSPLPPARRNLVLLALFAVGAIALESRLAWLQLISGEELIAAGHLRQLREVTIPAHRGVITDRNGEPLAVSSPVDSIWVDPKTITVEQDGVINLAKALDLDGEALERAITSSSNKEFVWVERQLPPADAAEIITLGIAGVHTQREYKRYYPMHEITCQLVGLTNTDGEGIEGLELNFNADLIGEPGTKRVQVDRKRRVIADVEEITPARPGNDLRLSVDMAIQYPAYRELKAAIEETGASSGSLVMLDIETGEVLALANQPLCNPNNDEHRASPDRLRNRAISDAFEPGSTIKPLIIAAALQNGLSADALIHIDPNTEVGGVILEDDRADPNGDTITNILARSSNAGMVTIVNDLDPGAMWQTLKNFGLAGPTGSGLGTGERHGLLPDFSLWGSTRKKTLSYGYGLTVTAVQLARGYAAIASGGLLPPVSFVALDEPPERVRIMSREIAADLTLMLEAVVDSEQATARLAAIPNFTVAGKTGTVQIHGPDGYYDDRHRAIFAGFAPASDPRFVTVVILNDPQGREYYGGQIAAPLFSRVTEIALRLYGVPPDALPEHVQLTSTLPGDRQ